MLALCPSCRNAVDVPVAAGPQTYRCPLCQTVFMVGATVPEALPVAGPTPLRVEPAPAEQGPAKPARAKAQRVAWEPSQTRDASSRPWGWAGLASLLITGVVTFMVIQSRSQQPGPKAETAGESADLFVKSIGQNERVIGDATEAAEKKNKERNEQIRLQNSAEAVEALRAAKSEIEANRNARANMYTLLWFDGDRSLGTAMVEVVLSTLTQEIEAHHDSVRGNEWMFQPGDEPVIARLWPGMRAHSTLRAWMEANEIKEEIDFRWHLLIRMKPNEADPKNFPPDVAGLRPDITGTGFWVSPSGYLLTNQHVVAGARSIDLRLASRAIIPAKVVREDAERDLALLKAEVQTPEWLTLSAGDAPQGSEVFTQGFPNPRVQGLAAKYSDGKVSSLSGMNDDERVYQVSLPVQPGNSGGALIHPNRGFPWVVGVVSGKLIGGENVNYAIKTTVVRQFLNEFEEGRLVISQPQQPKPADTPVEHARKASCVVLVKTR